LIIRNDSVENGVVHTLNKVITPSNMFLPQLIAEDPTISIFNYVLQITGIDKKMESYIDETYSVGPDSLDLRLIYNSAGERPADYPAKRKFCFTAFVEPNSVYESKGITSGKELIEKLVSKQLPVYDQYGRYTYDQNYSDTNNVVYRFESQIVNFTFLKIFSSKYYSH